MDLFSNPFFEKYLGGEMPDSSNGQKVFVLRDSRGLFFREYRWSSVSKEPIQWWFVEVLVAARGFQSRELAVAFQTFLKTHSFPTDILEVEQGRLLRVPRDPPILHPREIARAAAAAAKLAKQKLRIHLLKIGEKMRRTVGRAFEALDGPGSARLRKNRRHHHGALLIELCIVMCVLLVLFSMSAPSFMAMHRAQQAKVAIELMQRVAKAELYHSQIYSDGYRSPGALSAPVTFPKTCEGSGLLLGSDALPQVSGYQFTFQLGLVQAPLAAGCNFQGSTTYTMTATSIDAANPRTFFLDETGVVRFSDTTTPANAGSTAWVW